MGYILPIVQNSHKNYHYRMIKIDQSPHHIERPFKVVMGNQSEIVNPKKQKNVTRTIPSTLKNNRALLDEMTHGLLLKGRLIDEKV